MRGPVVLRARIFEGLIFVRVDALGKLIGIVRRRGNHRQNIAIAHIHHHHGTANTRTPMVAQRILGRLLDIHVHRQHHVVAGLGFIPDVGRLAVAEIVHEHGFRTGPAVQIIIELAFDT